MSAVACCLESTATIALSGSVPLGRRSPGSSILLVIHGQPPLTQSSFTIIFNFAFVHTHRELKEFERARSQMNVSDHVVTGMGAMGAAGRGPGILHNTGTVKRPSATANMPGGGEDGKPSKQLKTASSTPAKLGTIRPVTFIRSKGPAGGGGDHSAVRSAGKDDSVADEANQEARKECSAAGKHINSGGGGAAALGMLADYGSESESD